MLNTKLTLTVQPQIPHAQTKQILNARRYEAAGKRGGVVALRRIVLVLSGLLMVILNCSYIYVYYAQHGKYWSDMFMSYVCSKLIWSMSIQVIYIYLYYGVFLFGFDRNMARILNENCFDYIIGLAWDQNLIVCQYELSGTRKKLHKTKASLGPDIFKSNTRCIILNPRCFLVRKTDVLFIVLVVASYIFCPSIGQFVDTKLKKIPSLLRQTNQQAIFRRLHKN